MRTYPTPSPVGGSTRTTQPTIDRRVLIADHALLLRALRLAAAADAKEPRWAQAVDELAALLRSYRQRQSTHACIR